MSPCAQPLAGRPWNIEDNGACFIVRDAHGQALTYIYYESQGAGQQRDYSFATKQGASPLYLEVIS